MPAKQTPKFRTIVSRSDEVRRASQRLRYDVFVQELGADGPLVDHAKRLEADAFDAYADHLILLDENRAVGDQVVGAYRLMTMAKATEAGQFYCEDEYDLTCLRKSGKRLLELGRSCLHPSYRNGTGMLHLWSALSDYVNIHQIEVLFGVASFHGTDTDSLAAPLSLLYHRHLAPEPLRVKATGPTAIGMNLQSAAALDRVTAVRQLPALIKAYLRLGGAVGDGAFVDHAFNTTDVCLILESDAIQGLQRAMLSKGTARG